MRVPLLDHGYLDLVETWGSDERIVEAARMSTGKGFLGWGPTCPECDFAKVAEDHDAGCSMAGRVEEIPWKAGDEKLLRYLWEHKHATPFEMAGMTVEVQAPIFVFREWHRHRTQSYNELSARYTPLPDINYVPDVANLVERARAAETAANKQVRAESRRGAVDSFELQDWLAELAKAYRHAQDVYEEGLRRGVPKELARLPVPVARYSRMRASANLRNWLAFLTLRMDSAAQYEIRQYANAVGSLIAVAFPRTWALFAEARHG